MQYITKVATYRTNYFSANSLNMKVISATVFLAVIAASSAAPFISNMIGGMQPNYYTNLDLSQVDFDSFQQSDHGHENFIRVRDDDGSGEDFYQLVGVAPSSAVEGGSAMTYSANMGSTVPVYSEMDDDMDDLMMYRHIARMQPSQFRVRAEGTLDRNNNYVVMLDD